MAAPLFTRSLSTSTYKGQPYVLAQVRFDYFNWGSRSVVFDGTAVPAVGTETALTGKDESGGSNQSGWAFQMRLICPAAGRPQHPISVQLITTSAGSHPYG